ncbi:MAG: TrbI/VirB10 family protein [Devosia sp.]
MGATDIPERPEAVPPSLAPKVDPQAMTLRASPQPVTRLNRRMLAVLAGGLSAIVLGATLWSLQPARRVKGTGTEVYHVDRVPRAQELDQLPSDYAQMPEKVALPVKLAPPVLGPPLPGDLGPAIVKVGQPMGMRASDSAGGTGGLDGPGGGVDPAQAERLAAEAAARSSVFFRNSGESGGAKPATVAVAAGADSAALATAPGSQPFNPMAPASQPPTDPTVAQNRQDQKEAFLAKAGEGATRNTGSLQLPASPYEVMAGTIIPAALVTGINSDLPGQVIASVTEAVYDTATGRHLLIPQGSRLLGRYDSQVAFGQRRVLLVWTRLILPDTSSVSLDKLPGIDPAGYAGLEDGVNWHWDRILAGAALSTLLGVGAELAVSNQGNVNGNAVIALRDSAQDTTNQVGQEITRRNLSIQPTLTIRPGFVMRVMVVKDLILRPYQPLFFQTGTSR